MTEYPKISFRIAPPALDYVQQFAAREGMTLSEALRYIVDVGREAIERETYKPPTRGFMPRPTGDIGSGNETEQERTAPLQSDSAQQASAERRANYH